MPVEHVAIVGSREFCCLYLVRDYVLTLPNDTIVVSGGARGVDRAGELAALEAGLATRIFFPDLKQYDYVTAMRIRNDEIARFCTRMVCFWDGKSGGSLDAMARARLHRKPLERVIRRRPPPGRTSDNPGVLQPVPGWWRRDDQVKKVEPRRLSPAQEKARRARGRG